MELKARVKEASKTPINRSEVIDIIKEFAGEEFENLNDVWEVAKKSDGEIVGDLHSILTYYENQQKTNKEDVINHLENLVMSRFDKKEDLERKLQELFKVNISISDKTRYEDEEEMDFNFLANIFKDDVFCDVDIYYIYDNNKRIVITEVGYEFQ